MVAQKSLFSDKEKSVLFVGVFFAALVLSQYILSLDDRYYEITKHLTAGNYAVALSLPFTFVAIISAAHRFLRSTLLNKKRYPHDDNN
jgi:hypothetical protein